MSEPAWLFVCPSAQDGWLQNLGQVMGAVLALEPDQLSLLGELAVRGAFEDAAALPVAGFAFLAHGTPNAIRGNDRRELFDASNAYLASGRHVYALACSSASSLARSAVESGAVVYVG